ncbi:MAG: undecaprenyldiphospho-muramoylpentapeptide beta-N-acetylglucosaminyltransferase [Candidatus Cyclobacteriaceae bacterium M2_1C_046]
MTEKKPYRLIFSGGGTGGHIFPAVAVADRFKEKYPDANILFVGAQGKMEMVRIPKAGYEIIGLWISGLQRRITLQNVLFPVKVIVSYLMARRIIKQFKPDVVIGTGGYASGPIVMAATQKGVATVLQEQNSYAGLANKNVALKADKICVAYENMERFFPKHKIVITGNPVRKDLLKELPSKSEALAYWGLKEDRQTILIVGGSLGARTINDSVLKSLPEWKEHNIQVIWQTGRFYYDEMSRKARKIDYEDLEIKEFIDDMNMAYAAADIIISRAGALSISEHCLIKKPVIYIPSPNVAEDHQRKNAKALVDKDAAIMIKDIEAREKLSGKVTKLIKDKDRQRELSQNIAQLGKPDAAEQIVREIEKLLN